MAFAHASTVMLSKSEVDFEHPAKGNNHCGECKLFKSDTNRCQLIIGKIESGDWCKKFEAK